MVSSKIKALTFVFALLLVTGFFTAGCTKQKAEKQGWVNTGSMPGHTFSTYTANNTKKSYPGIVYIGNENSSSPNIKFGPKEVSFNMKDLK